ncbi:MAG: IS256 family transposase [Phaeodactylibacter sp.]|nr:IS256 family transposase [Phaeodactylibacter sp.]
MKSDKKTSVSERSAFDFSSFEASAINALQSGKPLLGTEGVLKDLVRHLIEASLEGELDHQLAVDKSRSIPNKRNGSGRTKQIRSEFGPIEVQSPRDRQGNFEPQTVGKWSRELGKGFEAQILELYAMGNSVSDIKLHLDQMYGAQLSEGAISYVTERVRGEIHLWQTRPLESFYTLLYLDAIHYKVKEEGRIVVKAVYTLYGVDGEGQRDILGIHIGPSEGSHQWALYLEDLKRRGVEDILFMAVDGLSGFPEAIERVFPQSIVQRCIVHMVRTSLIGVADKDRRPIVADLREIYTAADEAAALRALDRFEGKWGRKYSAIAPKWRDNWLELTAFLSFGQGIRRMIYTTNPIENLHRQMRKVTKTKGAWCSEAALIKQLYLTLMRKKKAWSKTVFKWSQIQQELILMFGERYLKHINP